MKAEGKWDRVGIQGLKGRDEAEARKGQSKSWKNEKGQRNKGVKE